VKLPDHQLIGCDMTAATLRHVGGELPFAAGKPFFLTNKSLFQATTLPLQLNLLLNS
jgi:hypothetical protein